MLKFIYKTMLIALLSCSLMTLDFNSKGIQFQSAQAESVKTEGIDDSNMMATLTMTAVGVLTQRLWSCKLTTDMMIAAAGGTLFVAGEILAYVKLKKVMKDLETEITRDKNGKIEQKQIESLETLKKSYEEAKKTANTKKMLQQAAAAAFAAAGVSAYTQIAAEGSAEATCLTAMQTAVATCTTKGTALSSNPYTAAVGALFLEGAATAQTAVGEETAQDAAEKVPAPSVAKAGEATTAEAAITATEAAAITCPLTSAGAAACGAKRALKMVNKGVCPTLVSSAVPSYLRYAEVQSVVPAHYRILEMLAEHIIGSAKADLFSPMGIASSAAISFLLATHATLGPSIDSFLFSPTNRAIVWGMLAGLTYAASSATDNVISKIDANISKINAILNPMYNIGDGKETTNPKLTNQSVKVQGIDPKLGKFGNGTEDMDMSDVPGGKMPCFTGDGKECKSLEEKMEKDQGFIAMNAPSQAMVRDIMKTADGYNGKSKITSGTLNDTAKLAGSVKAINNTLSKAKLNYNSKIKDKKQNSDAREKALADSIEKSVRAQLKKSGMSSSQMMGAMYGGSISGSSAPTAIADTSKDSKTDSKVGDIGVIDIGASAAVAPTDLGLTSEVPSNELSDEEKNAALAAANENAPSIDDYDLKNDISKDKDTSIFEILSNRYQKSGYQRLFKRVK